MVLSTRGSLQDEEKSPSNTRSLLVKRGGGPERIARKPGCQKTSDLAYQVESLNRNLSLSLSLFV